MFKKHLPTVSTGGGGTTTGGTGSSTGTTNEVRDTIYKSMSLNAGYFPGLDRDIPSGQLPDSVNAAIDNQRDPLFPTYTGSIDSPITGGAGNPGTPGTPGTPGSGGIGGHGNGLDLEYFISRLVTKILSGLGNKMKMEFVSNVNGKNFWQISNEQLLKNLSRY